MNIKKHIIVLFGPTGVGKSDFAESLAHSLPIEIVNADMGQLYVPLTIGTAKPAWRESAIKHHLFDYVDTPKNFTIVEYRALVKELIERIWRSNRIPVIVGGSTFYIQSLFFAPSELAQPTVVTNGTWHDLFAIDPERASKIHQHDAYRINRALTIWQSTGKKPSEYGMRFDPVAPFHLFFLTRPRAQLYDRINDRVKQMVEAGWLHEVEQLMGTPWEKFLREKKIIGYPELLAYADDHNGLSKDEVIALIQQKTRAYAKRQYTFWRMLKKKILHELDQRNETDSYCHEIDLTLFDHELYIRQLSENLIKK